MLTFVLGWPSAGTRTVSLVGLRITASFDSAALRSGFRHITLLGLLGLALILAACGQPRTTTQPITPLPSVTGIQLKSTALPTLEGPATTPFDTPTPDPTRVVDDAGTELYIVQNGDTFSGIASEFGATPEEIAQINGLTTLSMIHPGDPLNVPLKLDRVGPGAKLIPDSELIYGPGTMDFDLAAFIGRTDGYLKSYTEKVDGETLTGAQVVQRVAEQFSVKVREGVLVTGFLGGNSNSTTGDFSLGVRGFAVRGGQVAEPVGEMNVSGNHLELWRRLAAVGDDPYRYSPLRTPTLVFEGVQFAGV